MRILHVTTSLGDGGAEAILFRLIRATPAIDHIVVSLTPGGRYIAELRELGVEVKVVDMTSAMKTVAGVLGFPALVSKIKPDIIQAWMYHSNLLTGLYRIFRKSPPIFWGIRQSGLQRGIDPWRTHVASWVCAKLSSRIPEAIVCAGQKAKSVHEKAGYASDKLVVIPNGYDTTVLRPNSIVREEVRNSLGISSDEFVIGMVARHHPAKDHNNLFQGLASLKHLGIEFRCLLVGAGMDNSNSSLRNLSKSLNVSNRVFFLGPQADLERFYCSLDVHVLSSVSEAFPNVLAESMACGTPCVTTNVGDAALIVGDSGFISAPSDPEALAQALLAAYEEKLDQQSWIKRQEMARNRIVDNYQISKMVEQFISVWNSSEYTPPRPT